MNLFESKLFSLLLAFVLGGVSTYFVADYLRLKKNHFVSEVSKSPMNDNHNKRSIIKKDQDLDPFSQMDRFHNQLQKKMYSMFDTNMFGGSLFNSEADAFFSDDIKISEYEDKNYKYVEIMADGIDKDSLNIDIANGMISISGEVRKSSKDNNSMSRYVSSFSRSFNIPQGVSEESVKINTEDKKILIKFPKRRV